MTATAKSTAPVGLGLFLHDEERFAEPTIVNTPIVADGAPRARGPAPRLGADTIAPLAELGYGDDRIAALIEGGIASVPDAGEAATCTARDSPRAATPAVRGAKAQK